MRGRALSHISAQAASTDCTKSGAAAVKTSGASKCCILNIITHHIRAKGTVADIRKCMEKQHLKCTRMTTSNVHWDGP
eukprot:9667565-Karenia_brevis.AAC.1